MKKVKQFFVMNQKCIYVVVAATAIYVSGWVFLAEELGDLLTALPICLAIVLGITWLSAISPTEQREIDEACKRYEVEERKRNIMENRQWKAAYGRGYDDALVNHCDKKLPRTYECRREALNAFLCSEVSKVSANAKRKPRKRRSTKKENNNE